MYIHKKTSESPNIYNALAIENPRPFVGFCYPAASFYVVITKFWDFQLLEDTVSRMFMMIHRVIFIIWNIKDRNLNDLRSTVENFNFLNDLAN